MSGASLCVRDCPACLRALLVIHSNRHGSQGPRTPIMHIEPRRLGIKKTYQTPTTSQLINALANIAKPKSSGGAADDFERAPSLTTLAPSKPRTAPKEDSQVRLHIVNLISLPNTSAGR